MFGSATTFLLLRGRCGSSVARAAIVSVNLGRGNGRRCSANGIIGRTGGIGGIAIRFEFITKDLFGVAAIYQVGTAKGLSEGLRFGKIIRVTSFQCVRVRVDGDWGVLGIPVNIIEALSEVRRWGRSIWVFRDCSFVV